MFLPLEPLEPLEPLVPFYFLAIFNYQGGGKKLTYDYICNESAKNGFLIS